MNYSDFEIMGEYPFYSDFGGYRFLYPENSSISALLQKNPELDIFCLNDIIMPEQLGDYQNASSKNDQACEDNKSQSTNKQRKSSTRANNTIFKTSAIYFRQVNAKLAQSIYECIGNIPAMAWIQNILKSTFKIYNLSLFPKLLAIVKQIGIQNQVGLIWKQKSSKILEKKHKLLKQGKFCSLRYQQLQRSIKTMNLCLNQTDLVNALEIYWGKYKHIRKYENSKREVLLFQSELKRRKSLNDKNLSKEKTQGKKSMNKITPIKNHQIISFQIELLPFSFTEQPSPQNISDNFSHQLQKSPL